MPDIREYLETRFREYFRDATFIAIQPSDEDCEATEVTITVPHPQLKDGFDYVFVCSPGSDDDFFLFEEFDGQFPNLTIPFPPEA